MAKSQPKRKEDGTTGKTRTSTSGGSGRKEDGTTGKIVDPELSRTEHGLVGDDQLTTRKDEAVRVVKGKEEISEGQRARSKPLQDALGKSELEDQDTRTTRKIIGPKDDRILLSNAKVEQKPFRWICSLDIKSLQTGYAFSGTGWMISPRVVITAGHCVYDDFLPKGQSGPRHWASKITVRPGRIPSAAPWGECHCTQADFVSLSPWIEDAAHDTDIAAIFLPPPEDWMKLPHGWNPDDFGYFGFATNSDRELESLYLNISGYPGADPEQQYWHDDQATDVRSTYFLYTIDTTGGQSGSPVWFYDGEKRYVVGVHNQAWTYNNHAVRIDDTLFDFLLECKNEFS